MLALVKKYKQEGAAFVPKYLDLLAAGGSEAPHVLLAGWAWTSPTRLLGAGPEAARRHGDGGGATGGVGRIGQHGPGWQGQGGIRRDAARPPLLKSVHFVHDSLPRR